MKLKKLIYRINPPCAKCPYKLGLVETLVNPCPKCKLDGYSAYERFLKMPWQGKTPKNNEGK